LSAMEIEAVFDPFGDWGENTTFTVQLAPAFKVEQLLLWKKLFAFVPVRPMDEITRLDPPVFCTTIDRAALDDPMICEPNDKLLGVRLIPGALFAPVPFRSTVCGDGIESSLTLNVAVRSPTADGVNFTVIEQLLPGVSVAPQVVVFENSAAFVPLIVIDEMCSVAPPLFSRVLTCPALVVPTT
jgi:hypothetical protein